MCNVGITASLNPGSSMWASGAARQGWQGGCQGATCSWELPAPGGIHGVSVMNEPAVPV